MPSRSRSWRIVLALAAVLAIMPAAAGAASLEDAEAALLRGDFAAALDGFQQLADSGHADAQFRLAQMYEHGEGVDADPTAALQWYRRAAEGDHAAAQFRLGELYLNGQGVEVDGAEAVAWYTRAAEQGLVDAQYMLGILFLQGEAVAKDAERAEYWLTEAAGNADGDAAALLGSVYFYGADLPQDLEQAYVFLSMGEQQGNSAARLLLARMYREGLGVDRNDELAMQLVERAASQGNAIAMAQLIPLYADMPFRNRAGQLVYMMATRALWTEANRPPTVAAQPLPPDMADLAQGVVRQAERLVPVSVRREADAIEEAWDTLLLRAWQGMLEPGDGDLLRGLNGPQPVIVRYLDGSLALAVHPDHGLFTVPATTPPRMTPRELEGIGLGDYVPPDPLLQGETE